MDILICIVAPANVFGRKFTDTFTDEDGAEDWVSGKLVEC